MQRDHLDSSANGFKALVSRFERAAVERMFNRLSDQHAECMRNAGLLMRLADTARDFVVDRFIMRGFGTEKHPPSAALIRFPYSPPALASWDKFVSRSVDC